MNRSVRIRSKNLLFSKANSWRLSSSIASLADNLSGTSIEVKADGEQLLYLDYARYLLSIVQQKKVDATDFLHYKSKADSWKFTLTDTPLTSNTFLEPNVAFSADS